MFNRKKVALLCLVGFCSVVILLLADGNRNRTVDTDMVGGQDAVTEQDRIYPQSVNNLQNTMPEPEKRSVALPQALSSAPLTKKVVPDQVKLQNGEQEIALLIEEYHNNLDDPAIRQALEQQISQVTSQYKEQVLAKVKQTMATRSEAKPQ